MLGVGADGGGICPAALAFFALRLGDGDLELIIVRFFELDLGHDEYGFQLGKHLLDEVVFFAARLEGHAGLERGLDDLLLDDDLERLFDGIAQLVDAIPRGDKVIVNVDGDGLRHAVIQDVLGVVGGTVRQVSPDLVSGVCQDRSEHTGERIEDQIHRRLCGAALFGIRLFGI